MPANDTDDLEDDDVDDEGEVEVDDPRMNTLCSACDSDLVDVLDESGKRWRVCPLADSEPTAGHLQVLLPNDDVAAFDDFDDGDLDD